METDNLLVFVAVVAVALSLVGTIVTYNSVSKFNDFITGFSVEQGVVNVTIDSSAIIEIISAGGQEGQKNITWGAGIVNTTGGHTYAVLATNGTVYGGEGWEAVNEGFIVQNIGNVNVTLNISASNAAADFIGGSGPLFQYNLTNNEDDSCLDFEISEGTYRDFLSGSERVCNNFGFTAGRDKLQIDILLRIPDDSDRGTRNSTISLAYEQV
jgi:hypothetical protein